MLNTPKVSLSLTFKMEHEGGIHSPFYKKRNFKTDAETIFDLLQYDTLFIAHECLLEFESDTSFTITVNNFCLPNEKCSYNQSSDYLLFVIGNKLEIKGLYEFFHISQIKNSFASVDCVIFNVNYDKKSLVHKVIEGRNTKIIKNFKFPEENIQEEFFCELSGDIISIPAYDSRSDSVKLDYRCILRQIKQTYKNPLTNIYLPLEKLCFDYVLWDKIENFIEKIELVHNELIKHNQPIDYQDHLERINDTMISSLELGNTINYNDFNEIFKKIKNYFWEHRYCHCIYLASVCLKNKDKFDEKQLQIIKLYDATARMRYESYQNALELCDELKQFNIEEDPVLAVFFLMLSRYHLTTNDRNCFQTCLLLLDKCSQKNFIKKEDLHFFEQTKLLANSKCGITNIEQGKALRRIAYLGNSSDLKKALIYLDVDINIKDNVKEEGYTALHLALMREDENIENAWLLRINGVRFDIKNAIGNTASEIIEKSKNPKIKELNQPYIKFLLSVNLENSNETKIMSGLRSLAYNLGLTDNNNMFYLPSINSVVISSCMLPSHLPSMFINFCNECIVKTPLAAGLFKFDEISQLFDQKNLLQPMKVCLKISSLVNFETSNMPNQNQFFRNNYQKCLVEAVGAFFETSQLINKKELIINCKNDKKIFEITLDCSVAPYLLVFLKAELNFYLSNAKLGKVNCDEFVILSDNKLQQHFAKNLIY